MSWALYIESKGSHAEGVLKGSPPLDPRSEAIKLVGFWDSEPESKSQSTSAPYFCGPCSRTSSCSAFIYEGTLCVLHSTLHNFGKAKVACFFEESHAFEFRRVDFRCA